jgi:hypothetical protein
MWILPHFISTLRLLSNTDADDAAELIRAKDQIQIAEQNGSCPVEAVMVKRI